MAAQKKYIVITGASKGLGKSYAIELAKRGENLILIAMPDTKLEELASWLITHYKVDIKVYTCDLTQWQAPAEICQSITSAYEIKGLINNAGIGGSNHFENSDATYLDNIIMLNIRALTLLTRYLLPSLQKSKGAFVMNIASMASFSPMPYKSIYPASKAFVYSFTRSLREELSDKGVSVSVVHPGPMLTNVDVTERIIKQGWLARLSLLGTQEIVNISLSEMQKGTAVIIPGLVNKLLYLAMRYLPDSIRLELAARIVKREVKPTIW